MYLIYFAGLCALMITPTVTAQIANCNERNCSQDPGKVAIRTVDSSSPGQNATKTCPDNQTLCEDDETCCALNIGGYGCCDPDHSRCCGDGVHCCPNDQVTKPKVHRVHLVQGHGIPISVQLNKINIDQFNSSSVGSQCPGSTFQCQSNQTCCKDEDSDWACCNFPNATCCSDGLHCCPSGYKCRLDISRCVRTKKKLIIK